MVVKHIQRILEEKSRKHRADLKKLRLQVAEERLSNHVLPMPPTSQLIGMGTIIQDRDTDREEFIFYFDRLSALLIERYVPATLYQA
jgi:uridine kinase